MCPFSGGVEVTLIDFHVHAFSEKIAARALSSLSANSGLAPLTDGTLEHTKKRLDEWGVDKAVILSIATKPSQQRLITDWAAGVKSERMLPFGSVHPDAEDVLDELSVIKEKGLYGIKFHPDYQGFKIDDEKMLPIYKRCEELSLPVLFHSGFDYYSPGEIHCTPQRALKVIKAFPHMKIILAHLGANRMWESVLDTLAGVDGQVYFDTAFTQECDSSLMEKIILRHGADRVLFASDCPWASPVKIKEKIEALHISDDMKDKIFYENALALIL